VNLWVETITAIAEAVGKMGATLFFGVGIALITGFLDGMIDQVQKLWDWITGFVEKIINMVKSALGINSPSTVFKAIGVDLMVGFLNGIIEAAVAVMNWFKSLAKNIISWVGDMATTLKDKGYELIVGFWNGITERWTGVFNFFSGLGGKIVDAVGDIADSLFNVGKSVIQGLWDGMQAIWEKAKSWLGNLNPANWFNDINPKKGHAEKNLVPVGEKVMEGLHTGMKSGWDGVTSWLTTLNPADAVNSDAITATFQQVINSAAMAVSEMDAVQPVITPVLDLSQVREGAMGIQSMFRQPGMALNSLDLAKQISLGTTRTAPDDTTQPASAGDVTYPQNVYAPKQLSTSDVYRQTRNLLAVRKEELVIR